KLPANAVTLSTNPIVPSGLGADTHINVSGDTNVGIVPVGLNPVFLGKGGANAFVINQGDASNPPTVTLYVSLLAGNASPSTVTLPSTSLGPIAGGTSSSGNIYIANNVSNSVDVISTAVQAQIATIPLPANSHPVMIAGNAANNQIFVANSNGTVTQISTIDNTIVGGPIPVGASPIWAVMSTDGFFVYVVNQGDGTVTVLDAGQQSP